MTDSARDIELDDNLDIPDAFQFPNISTNVIDLYISSNCSANSNYFILSLFNRKKNTEKIIYSLLTA